MAIIMVRSRIHWRSGDAATVDCGLHRNDEAFFANEIRERELFIFGKKKKND